MGLKLSRMTSRLPIIIPLLVLLSGMFITRSCEDDSQGQNVIREEQRFFDIYVASNYPDAVLQPSGIYFLENKEGDGQMPDDTSWLWIEHVAYTIPEEQVYETYLENVALDNRIHDTSALYGPYKVRNDVINEGFTAGLKMMQEGGEATLMFTSDLGFGSNNSRVGAYTSLKYEVRLLEVIEDILAYESEKILAYVDTIEGVQAVLDTIDNVNMYYVIDQSTDGPPVASDSTIEVAYKGYLIDGRVFDESVGDKGFKFTVDDENAGVINGWNLGLQSFKEGEKGRLIIPYPLAYGEFGQYTEKGNVSIPPYETLVFDVEVLSVEAGDDNDFLEDKE
jgi:FKBP-type peptidyl-prolyl cis-trans isomerase